jgi:hypothetical protein
MPATYDRLQTTTLSSSQTSVTFSSINQTYTDLVLVVSAYSDRAANADSLAVRFNGDTGSNYRYIYIIAETSLNLIAGQASSQSNIWCGNISANNVANPSPIIINIQDYKNTTTTKAIITRHNSIATGYNSVGCNTGYWQDTAAINSVTVRSELSANFVAGSTFTLYGIKAA